MTRLRATPVSCVLAILLFATWPLYAQSIRGVVTDAKTGAVLTGVNVFIAHTTLGASTDEAGRFEIANVPDGAHEVVASMIGFRPALQAVRVKGGPLVVDFALEEVVYENDGIEVVAERPRDWKKHLKKFETLFIGESRNAPGCEILNPFVLSFDVDPTTQTFRATASAPLLIENKALGYRMLFVLQDFEWREGARMLRFKGQPRFEALAPDSERQRRRWDARREVAYKGSFSHFLASLVAGTTTETGFTLRETDQLSVITTMAQIEAMPVVEPDSLLSPGEAPNERMLFLPLDRFLYVTYDGEGEELKYTARQREAGRGVRPLSRLGKQSSHLQLLAPAVVNERGYLNNPYDARTYGYWFWERIAEMLPRDYEPPAPQ